MIERIFVRLGTNVRLNECSFANEYSYGNEYLFTTYGQLHDFVYIGGIGNIYSYLNCLLLANLCLTHFVAIIILL